ncbi:MAG: MoaD/ThiS family protein [Methanosarcinales archaeon]
MKVKINYDYNQQKLMGKSEEFEVKENTTLGEFIKIVDSQILSKGIEKNIKVKDLTILRENGTLNSCVVMVNGQSPEGKLEYLLQDGDCIDLMYSFCGG